MGSGNGMLRRLAGDGRLTLRAAPFDRVGAMVAIRPQALSRQLPIAYLEDIIHL
jgi:hypothetical protein